MRRARGTVVTCLAVGMVLSTGSARAASDLPWTDANPLEGSSSHRVKPKVDRKAESQKVKAAI